MQPSPIRDLIVATFGFIPRLLVALLFLLVFWVVYRAVRKLIFASMGKASVDSSTSFWPCLTGK